MLNQGPMLDPVFQALSDPTRRAIVDRLSRGPASVSTLAAPLPMSLPAVMQHLHVLEASGLIRSGESRASSDLSDRARGDADGRAMDRRAASDVGTTLRPAGRLPRREPLRFAGSPPNTARRKETREMDPDVGRLLAGRTALESMPASDRRRPERSVGRSRSLTRLWMSAMSVSFRHAIASGRPQGDKLLRAPSAT